MTQTPRASAPPSEPADSHPSPAVLIAYHRDELTEAEADRVREHLVECEVCLQTVLAMEEMEADLRVVEPLEESSEDPAMLRSLERLRQRRASSTASQASAQGPAPAPEPRPVAMPARKLPPAAEVRGAGWGWAQAALVFLCLGLGGLSLSQRQELGRLSGPVGNLERLQLSAGSEVRGGEMVRLGPESGGLDVRVRVPLELEHASYRLELTLGDDAEASAVLPDLELGRGEALSAFFPHGALESGSYSLQAFGIDESGAETLLDTFRFRLDVER